MSPLNADSQASLKSECDRAFGTHNKCSDEALRVVYAHEQEQDEFMHMKFNNELSNLISHAQKMLQTNQS